MKGLDELMKQAQQMQQKMKEQMEKAQEARKLAEHRGESGAGLVKAVLNGNYAVKSLQLDDSLLTEDKSLVEDLIAAAINDAVRKVEEANQQAMSGMGAGFDLPAGFKFPFS